MKPIHLAGAMLALSLTTASALYADDDLAIADGLEVSLEYTLSIDDKDKTEVATNVGGQPLTFVQGSHQILPSLETAITGLKKGDKKNVELAAADAFGAYDEEAVMTVKKEQIPADAVAGSMLSTPDGRPVKILEVKETEVVLDLNHPLAAKDVIFAVTVLDVSKPQPPAADKPAGEGAADAPPPAPKED